MKTRRVKLSDDKLALRVVSTGPAPENKRSTGQDVTVVVKRGQITTSEPRQRLARRYGTKNLALRLFIMNQESER
jgi:hypothetical protein